MDKYIDKTRTIVVHRSEAVKKKEKKRWKSAQDNSKARDRPKEANDTHLL